MRTTATDPAPVVIVGAARSGTKLLRRIIAAAQDFHEVPHDVNYVWRHGAPTAPTDVIPREAAIAKTRDFVQTQLRRMARLPKAARGAFVEKTVSNALRVPYVDAVLPNARYVHLVRNGFDVTRSAMRCWQAPPEPMRLLSKLRGFPWRSCGGYAVRQGQEWVRRYLNSERRLRSWGPRYPGIEADVATRSLAEVCALQWRHCVDGARSGLSEIDDSRWIEITYEDLLNDPPETGARLGEFLRVEAPRSIAAAAAELVRPSAIDQSTTLSETDRQSVSTIVSRPSDNRSPAAAA